MLSPAVEDFLKTVYKLGGRESVSMSDMAASLGVSAAAVTGMAKRLDRLGLLRHQSYRGVGLTTAGEKVALEIIRHHRLLETYLREVMGYDWEAMHAEAELLEHHISEEFEQRIDEMLGYPTHDPHGNPIPTVDGQITVSPDEPLESVRPGITVMIRRLSDDEPQVLARLEELGLVPGATIEVLATGRKGGVTLRVEDRQHDVATVLAGRVFVTPAIQA